MAKQTYTYGDGTTVEIVDGSEIERDEDGEILYWRLPAITPAGERHPDSVEDYEPFFPRDGSTRRVLMHITDEDHVGRGPRNTVDRLAVELFEDPHSPGFKTVDVALVQQHLDTLANARRGTLDPVVALVEKRKDGTYGVTDAGRVELAN
jgi:hypothetical protein